MRRGWGCGGQKREFRDKRDKRKKNGRMGGEKRKGELRVCARAVLHECLSFPHKRFRIHDAYMEQRVAGCSR